MATYKVIQDIEAEDKLLGPLSLKAFVYAAIAAVLAYINFRIMLATGLGPMRWVVVLVLALPMFIFGLLAVPFGKDQPTEVWILSHIRFFLKPKRRIWNQSGISNLVTITAPKRPEKQLTKNLSQSEVKSRLKALALTLDSRGWAVKNVEPEASPIPFYLQGTQSDPDRLVDVSALPTSQSVADLHASDDIMDEQSNKTAQHFEVLINQAETTRKKGLLDKIRDSIHESEPEKHEKRHKGKKYPKAVGVRGLRSFEANENDPRFKDRLDRAVESMANIRTTRTEHSAEAAYSAPAQEERQRQQPPMTTDNQTAKMELAQSGNAFKISTLSQMANREAKVRQISPGEVEISLH